MISYFFNTAKAHIKGGKKYPKIDGTVNFKETKEGVLVTAKIKGLPQSFNKCTGKFFGFHIHEGNSCTGDSKDEFSNSKSHLNPTNCPHPFHVGDLPPLIENKGYAYMSVLMVIFHIVWVYLHKIDIPLIYPTIPCSLFIKYIIALKFSIFLYPLALDFILCIMLFVPSNTALVNLFSK